MGGCVSCEHYLPGSNICMMRKLQVVSVGEECDSYWSIVPKEKKESVQWEDKRHYPIEKSTVEELQSARCPYCKLYHTTPYAYHFQDYAYCPNCGERIKE